LKEASIPARIKRTEIQKIAALQSLIIAITAIIGWQWDKSLALAIIYGSAIFIIPNTYFAWKSFRFSGAAQSKLVIQSFYTGQTTKFVLTVIMFVVLFAIVKPVSVAVVFLSYGLNALFHVVVTAVVLNKS
jgi:ATP synthase protein I